MIVRWILQSRKLHQRCPIPARSSEEMAFDTRCAFWSDATRSTRWVIGRPICSTIRSSIDTDVICVGEFWHRGHPSGTTCFCMMEKRPRSSANFASGNSQRREVRVFTYEKFTTPAKFTSTASIATKDSWNKRICSHTFKNIESVSLATKPLQTCPVGSTTIRRNMRKAYRYARNVITLH